MKTKLSRKISEFKPKFYCHGHTINLAFLELRAKTREILKNVITSKATSELEKETKQHLLEPMCDQCYTCGRDVVFIKRGKKYTAKTKCSVANGFSIHFELNVPSGKIVVADDLREHFNPNATSDISMAFGRKQTTLAFANIGCAHGFVGNTCPGIYQVKPNEYVIIGNPQNIKGKNVGRIITDLWWYSIVDYDEYVRRAKHKPTEDIIKVKPGVYKFSHHYDNRKRINLAAKYDDPDVIYATFKWVRKPDPVRDFDAEFESVTFTAEQIIYDSIKKYPTLYGPLKKSNITGIQCKADYIFLVIGTGGIWHKNGHIQYDLDTPKNCPSLKIPIFKDVYSWYEISEYSTILAAAGHPKAYYPRIILNPSFARLAINIVNCIVECGYKSRSDATEKMKKQQIKLARECRERLVKLYPKEAKQVLDEFKRIK